MRQVRSPPSVNRFFMWHLTCHIIWSLCSIIMNIEAITTTRSGYCYIETVCRDSWQRHVQYAIFGVGLSTSLLTVAGILFMCHHFHNCPMNPRFFPEVSTPAIARRAHSLATTTTPAIQETFAELLSNQFMSLRRYMERCRFLQKKS